ncbi:MAG: hypothetical protein IE913_00040 [Halothiobacillus sp.]|nr:hypothetical protein [Halothiobacillus sp.]
METDSGVEQKFFQKLGKWVDEHGFAIGLIIFAAGAVGYLIVAWISHANLRQALEASIPGKNQAEIQAALIQSLGAWVAGAGVFLSATFAAISNFLLWTQRNQDARAEERRRLDDGTHRIEERARFEDSLRRQRLENTFSLIQRWDDPALFTARRFTRRLGDKSVHLSPAQIIREIDGDPTSDGQGVVATENSNEKIQAQESLRESLILVLNYFDHIRVSIKTERVDSELLRESLGETAEKICTRVKPWLDTWPKTSRRDINIFLAMMAGNDWKKLEGEQA